MKFFTVWVTNAEDILSICEIDIDLLRYDHRTWDQALDLFNQSLEQGYTCIMIAEESTE